MGHAVEEAAGAGEVPPVRTVAPGSADFTAGYADFTIAAYLSGSGSGIENARWFGSFHKDQTVTELRNRASGECDP